MGKLGMATSKEPKQEAAEKEQLSESACGVEVLEYPPTAEFSFDPAVYREDYLLEKYANFKPPSKVNVLLVSDGSLSKIVSDIVVAKGEPLVLENCHRLPEFQRDLFSLAWLRSRIGGATLEVRDLLLKKDIPMTFNDFLSKSQQKHPPIRYYGKDIDCPHEWQCAAKKLIPASLHHLGPSDLTRFLPAYLRVETAMVFVGHQGTHTPMHFDIGAALGHNLMVYAEDGCAALWTMVPRRYANEARVLCHRHGGGLTSLDQDNCTMPAHLLAEAEFPVVVFEQHVGDLVLVPSECAHQVVNTGHGCSVKYAWNRTTLHSLTHCLEKILPVNRRILKAETLRAKTHLEMVMHELRKKVEAWERDGQSPSLQRAQMEKHSKLIDIYARVIADECTSYASSSQGKPGLVDAKTPHQLACDYCHCDIWNSWFRCTACGSPHDLCLDCYAEGRRCREFTSMAWVSHRPVELYFQDLKTHCTLFNSCKAYCRVPSFARVAVYSSMQEILDLDPKYISPLTAALVLKDKYADVSSNVESTHQKPAVRTCHRCRLHRFDYDVVTCSTCHTRSFCHLCLANVYGRNPFKIARRRHWTCYACKQNSSAGQKTYRQTHSNKCYALDFGLSYNPINTADFIPNIIDVQTFFNKRPALDEVPAERLRLEARNHKQIMTFGPHESTSPLVGTHPCDRQNPSRKHLLHDASRLKRKMLCKNDLKSTYPPHTRIVKRAKELPPIWENPDHAPPGFAANDANPLKTVSPPEAKRKGKPGPNPDRARNARELRHDLPPVFKRDSFDGFVFETPTHSPKHSGSPRSVDAGPGYSKESHMQGKDRIVKPSSYPPSSVQDSATQMPDDRAKSCPV